MSARLPALAVLLLAGACAPAKQAWSEAAPARPEVFLDVLPRNAEIRLAGATVGAGPVSLQLGPDPALVEVMAAGFERGEARLDPRTQAGGRVSLVLRPIGYGEGRRLDIDDGPGLAAAAAWLLHAGRHADAAGFAERAVEIAPSAPAQRRVLGLALQRLGNRKRAAVELSQYLQLSPPDAPDRDEIGRLVARLRGDIGFPEPR